MSQKNASTSWRTVLILRHMNPVYLLPSYFCKISFNIILLIMPGSQESSIYYRHPHTSPISINVIQVWSCGNRSNKRIWLFFNKSEGRWKGEYSVIRNYKINYFTHLDFSLGSEIVRYFRYVTGDAFEYYILSRSWCWEVNLKWRMKYSD